MSRINEVQILPEALRAWRRVRGEQWTTTNKPLAQKDLAERAGVSPTLIAMIETGERQPSLSNGLAIARALKVSLLAIATCSADVEALIRNAENGGNGEEAA